MNCHLGIVLAVPTLKNESSFRTTMQFKGVFLYKQREREQKLDEFREFLLRSAVTNVTTILLEKMVVQTSTVKERRVLSYFSASTSYALLHRTIQSLIDFIVGLLNV